MAVNQKNVALLSEKRVLETYHEVDDVLPKRSPSVQEVYDRWVRDNKTWRIESVSCEAEVKVFIASTLEKHRLDVYAVFMRPIGEMDRQLLEKMVKIMYTKHSYSQLKISKYLDVPPDTAYNIIRKRIIALEDNKKYKELVKRREEEDAKKIMFEAAVREKGSQVEKAGFVTKF